MKWQAKPTEPGYHYCRIRGSPDTLCVLNVSPEHDWTGVEREFLPLPSPEQLIEREEALGFYANEDNYTPDEVENLVLGYGCMMAVDEGAKARAALGD